MAKQDNRVSLDDIVQDMCNLKDAYQEYMIVSKKRSVIQDSIIETQSEMINLYMKQMKELYIACIILGFVAVTSLCIIIALI